VPKTVKKALPPFWKNAAACSQADKILSLRAEHPYALAIATTMPGV